MERSGWPGGIAPDLVRIGLGWRVPSVNPLRAFPLGLVIQAGWSGLRQGGEEGIENTVQMMEE
tara:strand:+ start:1750 stop:1938 length:189 start_codon:yes stop_codon:yes gene_type:complete